jgi:uncharacterized protein YoxC
VEYITHFVWKHPPSVFLIGRVRGVYFLRTIKQVEREMDLVMGTLEKLQNAMTILMFEREQLIMIKKGLEASAEIETEQLIERIKQ